MLSALAMTVLISSGVAQPVTQSIDTLRFRVVHTERSEGSAQALAGELERLRDDIARLLGRDWPGKTEVRVGADREEYTALALEGGHVPSWATALAYPRENVILVEAHSLLSPDGPLTLRHELIHVALGQFAADAHWPHWFHEGLAQELTGERKWRTEHVATLTRAVTQDRVFDFDDLSDRFPSLPDDVEIAYAQSAAFIEFLRDRHGTGAFRRLIERVEGGDRFDTAFGVAFGVPRFMEEEAFRKELPRRYPWWPLLLSGGTLLWGAGGVLLVIAWFLRRREVRKLRTEQLRLETLHEAAQQLLLHDAVNDDAGAIAPPDELESGLWVVNLVVTLGAPARDDEQQGRHESSMRRH